MSTKASSPRQIANSVEKLYPTALAGSWDNVGLILEPFAPRQPTKGKVLLCIDLTTRVTNAAIADQDVALVLAYHPIVFRGLKSVTLADVQQRSLIRLTQAGIGVHCPHTSVDAIRGGVNDWLVQACLGDKDENRMQDVDPANPAPQLPSDTSSSKLEGKVEIVERVSAKGIEGHEDAGYGRIFAVDRPLSLQTIILRIKRALGLGSVGLVSPRAFDESTCQDLTEEIHGVRHEAETIAIIAVCAGSGGSVLKSLISRPRRPTDAPADASLYRPDLVLTGELSHHEALFYAEQGVAAILCGHSNTERPFLAQMKQDLEQQMQKDGHDIECIICHEDRDPITTA
ncbi:hypothetical protein PYCC9005_002081 [Savitreella phatthalungensis]